MNRRLVQALVAYAALGIVAYFILSGVTLLITLLVLAAFLAKTVLWHFKPQD